MPFLEAHDIVKSYPVGGTLLTVLRNLDIEVGAGEMLAIVGASGVGKSTLLHVLGGLDRVDRGTVAIGGIDLTALPDPEVVAFRNQRVGFVFQFHHLLPEFNALENAEMPMRIARMPMTEGSSSGWRWPGRLSCDRRCCWRTNRPATWTRPPPTPSTCSCGRCTRPTG
jgi:lipoprotein-releasing system ATP-binding protein